MLRCISIGNSIKFGIDQTYFTFRCIGQFHHGDVHCMNSFQSILFFFSLAITHHHTTLTQWNVSISVEKSALTILKLLYTIWHFVVWWFRLISSSTIWTWSIVIWLLFHFTPYSLAQMILPPLRTSEFFFGFWNSNMPRVKKCKNIRKGYKRSKHDSKLWKEIPAEN